MTQKAQPSFNPPSFSGDENTNVSITKREPMPMTQKEVDVMMKNGKTALKIAERFTSHGLTVTTEKSAPIAITAKDMVAINKSGVLPDNLLQQMDAPQEAEVKTEKSAPTFSPPRE